MRELGYVYNRGAANLRQASAKSRIIGVVVNDLTNSFFAELAVGVDMVVQSAGFVQFLSNTSESIDSQREVVASMREHGISGSSCRPLARPIRRLQAIVAAGNPVVVVVRNLPGAKASSVVSDNGRHGVRGQAPVGSSVTSASLFLGGFPDTAVFDERLTGYEGWRQPGSPMTKELISPGPPSRAGGVEAIGRAIFICRPYGSGTASTMP